MALLLNPSGELVYLKDDEEIPVDDDIYFNDGYDIITLSYINKKCNLDYPRDGLKAIYHNVHHGSLLIYENYFIHIFNENFSNKYDYTIEEHIYSKSNMIEICEDSVAIVDENIGKIIYMHRLKIVYFDLPKYDVLLSIFIFEPNSDFELVLDFILDEQVFFHNYLSPETDTYVESSIVKTNYLTIVKFVRSIFYFIKDGEVYTIRYGEDAGMLMDVGYFIGKNEGLRDPIVDVIGNLILITDKKNYYYISGLRLHSLPYNYTPYIKGKLQSKSARNV